MGPEAPDLEHFAVRELRRYLSELYGIESHVTQSLTTAADVYLVIGNPSTNPAIDRVLAWPQVSDQAMVLKQTMYEQRPMIILEGGSPSATLWAVYEYVERCGVPFLLEQDVFPDDPAPFPGPTGCHTRTSLPLPLLPSDQ